jgi:hypothetical protein
MISRLTFALVFSLTSLTLAATGCKGSDAVVGAPTEGYSQTRTLAEMLPSIKKSLTPPLTETTFGQPDAKSGSGLIIYTYLVDGGKKVNLFFPGPTALISNANLQETNGSTTPIPLLD